MQSEPLEIRRLKLDKWKFEGEFPKDVVDLPGRIWFVKKTIRQHTHVTTPTEELKDAKLPDGFRLYKEPLAAKALRERANRDVQELFDAETKQPTLVAFDQRKERGQYYIFASADTDVRVKALEALADIAERTPGLAEYIACYMDEVASIYGLSIDDIAEKARCILLRYDIGFGFWQHIDNVAWTNGGPVCTTSLGPDDVTYDMTPTLVPEARGASPLRIRFPASAIAVMDGSSRLEWSHGLPSGAKGAQKYSILLKFDRLADQVVGHNAILKTDVYESSRRD